LGNWNAGRLDKWNSDSSSQSSTIPLFHYFMTIDVITIFPEMIAGYLGQSMMKRAAEAGHVTFNLVNLRDFAEDKHSKTDERPFGGGPGMVMKPEPIFKAVESLRTERSRVILMCPQGAPFKQARAQALSEEDHLIFICGHYEGVDERVREALVDEEISIGDYVLTNGVLSAAVVIDAVVRLRPDVLGGEGATESESFSEPLLEGPQYTRPADFRGMKVPKELLSGDHGAIAKWRREQAEARTAERRPDLLS
jgi:tRNA (guanine37-N1)-methyltransferase